MKNYHQEEMAMLICQQWELKACLDDPALTTPNRQMLHLQLVRNVYQIACIVDVYQNPLLSFKFNGRSYRWYSEVIKDPHFELSEAETLLKEVFSLAKIGTAQVIQVGKPYRPVNDFIHANAESFRMNVML